MDQWAYEAVADQPPRARDDPSRLFLPGYPWIGNHPTRLATGLADLPEPRREYKLWRYALALDYEGVDELVRALSPMPCLGPGHLSALSNGLAERAAVLGDDSRWHLHIGDTLACARGDNSGGYLHQDGIWPRDPTGQRLPYEWASWLVRLTGEPRDPRTVPRRERCMAGTVSSSWPPFDDQKTPLGRVRTALIGELGATCHLCRSTLGVQVDHEHLTGAVRGLLCIPCNANVDFCMHPDDCPNTDYLNTPPAAPLRLTYPSIVRSRVDKERIAFLGLDPWSAGYTSRLIRP